MASPKSEPWWVLWVYVCSWLVYALKVLKLRTNQLVVWFVQFRVSNWLLIILPSPHLGALTHLSTPKVLRAKERAPTPYFFIVFTLDSHLNLSRSLGVRQLCSYPPGSNKYVMEPKGFLMYLNKGIAQGLSNNSRHEQYPFDSLYQTFFPMVFTKYPHKGITFL
jgi:hypothetical protein